MVTPASPDPSPPPAPLRPYWLRTAWYLTAQLLFAWLISLAYLTIVLSGYPGLAIVLLLPPFHYLSMMIVSTAAHPELGMMPTSAKVPEGHVVDPDRVVFLPVKPFTDLWLRRVLLATTVLMTATVAAYFLLPGATPSLFSQNFTTPLFVLMVASIIYMKALAPLRRFLRLSHAMHPRILSALLSTLLFWLWVDALFAGLFQLIAGVCRDGVLGWCTAGPQFTADLSSFLDALYFSTITLTTTGYGDIAPTAPLARLAVTVELILGIALLGFLVSRVAGYAPDHPMQSPDVSPDGSGEQRSQS